MLLSMHHASTDGWSSAVLLQEVQACYQALAEGGRLPPPLPIQYADFADWQRRRLDQTVVLDDGKAGSAAGIEGPSPAPTPNITMTVWQAQLTHWADRLANAPVLDMPLDHPRPC